MPSNTELEQAVLGSLLLSVEKYPEVDALITSGDFESDVHREIYECIDMNSDLLLAFLDGKIFSEKIINTYFKILEKMNLVQLSKDNYQRQ